MLYLNTLVQLGLFGRLQKTGLLMKSSVTSLMFFNETAVATVAGSEEPGWDKQSRAFYGCIISISTHLLQLSILHETLSCVTLHLRIPLVR